MVPFGTSLTHAVVNPNKLGKVRIVYDCSAKLNGVSLNNQSMQGPDLTTKLCVALLPPVQVRPSWQTFKLCIIRCEYRFRTEMRYVSCGVTAMALYITAWRCISLEVGGAPAAACMPWNGLFKTTRWVSLSSRQLWSVSMWTTCWHQSSPRLKRRKWFTDVRRQWKMVGSISQNTWQTTTNFWAH